MLRVTECKVGQQPKRGLHRAPADVQVWQARNVGLLDGLLAASGRELQCFRMFYPSFATSVEILCPDAWEAIH